MATKPKAKVIVKEPVTPPAVPVEFTLSSRTIKMFIGALVAFAALYGGWKVVWDDIRTFWRLEATQLVKDKDTEAKLKAISTKAEVGRAWVFSSIANANAFNAQQWATFCKALRLPEDACAQLKEQATQFRQEATAAKAAAMAAGKDN